MFKRLGLILAFVLMTTVASAAVDVSDTASGILDKIPNLKQGVAYSLVDGSGINYLSTIEVAKYKGVSFEVGVAGDVNSTDWKGVGVISYPIANLKDLGVEVPILNLIELNVGAYVGAGRIQLKNPDGGNQWDAGLSLTLLDIKW